MITILVLDGDSTRVVVVTGEFPKVQTPLKLEDVAYDFEACQKAAPEPEQESPVCSTAERLWEAEKSLPWTASGPIEWLRPAQLASTYG